MNVIAEFQGEYRWLSNFWQAFVWLEVEGRSELYPTVENAYQAAKVKNWEDRQLLIGCSPGESKRLARRLGLFPDWQDRKVDVMLGLLRQKFDHKRESDTPTSSVYNGHRIGHMAKKLLDTGDAQLIEGNTWNDTFYGVCNGVGQNILGKLLMQVRDELRTKLE